MPISAVVFIPITHKAFICTAFNKQNLSDISCDISMFRCHLLGDCFIPSFRQLGGQELGFKLMIHDGFGGQWKTQWDDIEKSQ